MKRYKFTSLVLLLYIAPLCAAEHTRDDWQSYGRDYRNQFFSPLQQIHQGNVAQIQQAWHFKTGIISGFQATPIVQNGVMYLSLPYSHVLALNAKTGQELWRYQHKTRVNWQFCCGPSNRGVAVADGKVFIGTADARLVALNAKNGQVIWDITVAGPITGETDKQVGDKTAYGATGVGISMAPIVYRGKVIIGITGVGYGLHLDQPRADAPLGAVVGVSGHYGRRGFLAAFSVADGKPIWQFDVVPTQGWEGNFVSHTADGIPLPRDVEREKTDIKHYTDAWQYGGGSAWSTPSIDEANDTLFFGTGNPSPQMDDVARPGDNLYTVSLVALNASTGKLKWAYQQVPHDVWGYDVASPISLFDYALDDKKTIPALGQASKTGWYYIHARDSGKLLRKSEAFVPQYQLFTKPTTEGVVLYPGILGGANWGASALDESQQMSFVGAIHAPIRYTLVDKPAQANLAAIRYTVSEPTKDARWGLLSGINLRTGDIRWQVKTSQPLTGGVLATAGGLVFMGEGNGNFNAYASNSGKLLWQVRAPAGVNAQPISYAIDGVQYVAVVAGGNAIFGYPLGDNVLVYRLK